MQLAVLGPPESWHTRDLQRAAGARHHIQAIPFTRVHSEIEGGVIHVGSRDADLSDFDAVMVRTMPPGSLEQVVFRMDALHQLESAGHCVINPPRAIEVAVDKYLALARLKQAGLDVPRTHTCQGIDEAMASFKDLGNDVVVKPLFGSEGRGITRINDAAIAVRTFKLLTQLGAVVYLQEFLPHEGFDFRLFVVGNKVMGIRRRNPLDWRTNVSRGAQAEPYRPDATATEIAQRAVAAVGAVIGGVDVLPIRDGGQVVLEVNAVPGWKALSRTLKVDVAAAVLDDVQQRAQKM